MTFQEQTNSSGTTATSPDSSSTRTGVMTATTEKEEKDKDEEEKRSTLKAAATSVSCLWHRYRKYTVVLGGILVYIPIGVPWYFGNLAAYLASYFRQQQQQQQQQQESSAVVDPQWIFSAFFIAFSLAIVLSGYMANAMGTRLTIFIAMLIHSGATFLSYFAIQHSMVALIVTFGAVGGLGAGLTYGPPMPIVSKWLPRHVGIASGVLLTGFGGGAVIYNELITFYINPDNIQPDVTTQRSSYFTQPEVLDKIPEVFLVLASLTLGIQIMGIALIRDPQEGDEIEEAESLELKPIVIKDQDTKPAGELTEINLQSDGASQTTVTETEVESKELSPLEVLKQKDFYILWITLGLNHYGYVIKNNYYKEFGAARVDNDHLLTTIGTVSTIAVAVSRLCWGLICDLIGIKMTVMVLLGSTSVYASFWYFTLLAGPGLYFLWTVMVTWILAGAFILFPLAALHLFGQRHYASNYGLISTVQKRQYRFPIPPASDCSASLLLFHFAFPAFHFYLLLALFVMDWIVVNLVSPPLIRALLDNHGWFAVFISIAASNLVGTVAALLLSTM